MMGILKDIKFFVIILIDKKVNKLEVKFNVILMNNLLLILMDLDFLVDSKMGNVYILFKIIVELDVFLFSYLD